MCKICDEYFKKVMEESKYPDIDTIRKSLSKIKLLDEKEVFPDESNKT